MAATRTSLATRVAFERASTAPTETLAVRYDRRENAAAMGVLPQRRATRAAADPFPGGLRFVADPH